MQPIASLSLALLQLAAASLSNLRSLQFFSVGYTSASMAGLTQLSALQHAAFEACELPSTLAEMTGLEVLEIDCRMEPAGAFTASLDSALAQLTQLTGLCLDWMPAASAALPSLAALSQLNWLYLRPMAAIQAPPTAEEAELLRSATLPIGPWQRSLQQLVTTFPLVRHSLPFLGGAEQLQRITFMQPPASQRGGEAEWCAFWQWAEHHAPLQHVAIATAGDPSAVDAASVDAALMQATLQLKDRRPGLRVTTPSPYYLKHDLVSEWRCFDLDPYTSVPAFFTVLSLRAPRCQHSSLCHCTLAVYIVLRHTHKIRPANVNVIVLCCTNLQGASPLCRPSTSLAEPCMGRTPGQSGHVFTPAGRYVPSSPVCAWIVRDRSQVMMNEN